MSHPITTQSKPVAKSKTLSALHHMANSMIASGEIVIIPSVVIFCIGVAGAGAFGAVAGLTVATAAFGAVAGLTVGATVANRFYSIHSIHHANALSPQIAKHFRRAGAALGLSVPLACGIAVGLKAHEYLSAEFATPTTAQVTPPVSTTTVTITGAAGLDCRFQKVSGLVPVAAVEPQMGGVRSSDKPVVLYALDSRCRVELK